MKDEKIREMVATLGEKKTPFLNDVESSIKNYISEQGKKCLCIVERSSSGEVYRRWSLDASMDYVTVLKRFCNGERYNGHELDSGLTDPVVELVTKKFERFYSDQGEVISKGLLSIIFSDKVFAESVIKTVVDSSSAHYAKNYVKHKAVEILMVQLHSTLTHTTATIAGSAVAKVVVGVLLKVILLNLKVIIAKVLASAAVKMLIVVAVKKFVAVAIIGAVVKFVAAKLGIALSSAMAIIILPVIVAFIMYEISTFPGHLGSKVSEKIRSDLSGNFDSINRSIITKITEEIFSNTGGGLGAALADSPEVQSAISDLLREL